MSRSQPTGARSRAAAYHVVRQAGPDRRSSDLEARWRQVLEVAPEGYVAVDSSHRVADWNRRAASLFGWTRDEAVGMPFSRLLADGSRDDYLVLLGLVGSTTPEAEPFDLAVVDRQGRRFDAECTVWGVDRRGEGVVHTLWHDVTARRRTEETAALLTAVVDGSTDAIVTRDLNGAVLTWNAGAERLYGWSAGEAVGRRDHFLLPPDKADQLDRLVRLLKKGDSPGPIETEQLTRGGERVPVALRLSPVRDRAGELVAIAALTRDVTEQRWLAVTLDSTLEQLQAAADEARASEAATRRFLADAAHQLRTPVAGIRACAEALLLGRPEDRDHLLAVMVRETARAGDLVTSLLRMARLDQGVALRVEAVDVAVACAEEVDRLRLLGPCLAVELIVPDRPVPPVATDGAALREILSNLGDNALTHAAARISLAVDQREGAVRVSVADDGPGIPAGTEERVFDRFVSLGGRGGSGLGLPIARALARALGGELAYDAAFVLTLPGEPPVT